MLKALSLSCEQIGREKFYSVRDDLIPSFFTYATWQSLVLSPEHAALHPLYVVLTADEREKLAQDDLGLTQAKILKKTGLSEKALSKRFEDHVTAFSEVNSRGRNPKYKITLANMNHLIPDAYSEVVRLYAPKTK
ncbi:hypothetical protein HZB01_02750 [Candidatus Woesearchaeota archaeon]|nr:hypothetical protein [Candidatus Woesearchaeota archaeon]